MRLSNARSIRLVRAPAIPGSSRSVEIEIAIEFGVEVAVEIDGRGEMDGRGRSRGRTPTPNVGASELRMASASLYSPDPVAD
jgi:hypothetical protein